MFRRKMPTNFTVVPVEDCNASGSNYDGNNLDEERHELLLGPSSGKIDMETPTSVGVICGPGTCWYCTQKSYYCISLDSLPAPPRYRSLFKSTC